MQPGQPVTGAGVGFPGDTLPRRPGVGCRSRHPEALARQGWASLEGCTAPPMAVALRDAAPRGAPPQHDGVRGLGWVERSETHQPGRLFAIGGFRFALPTLQFLRGCASPFSRRDASELCVNFGPRKRRGRRESRVRAAPAFSCAKCTKKTHTSIQVQRRQSGLPCAVVYGLLRALPGDRLSCHRRFVRTCPAKLSASTGAPGPHDFAVRAYLRSSSQAPRPPHPTARS